MPLVFIHGVNVDEGRNPTRDQHFKDHVLAKVAPNSSADNREIYTAFWGGVAPNVRLTAFPDNQTNNPTPELWQTPKRPIWPWLAEGDLNETLHELNKQPEYRSFSDEDFDEIRLFHMREETVEFNSDGEMFRTWSEVRAEATFPNPAALLDIPSTAFNVLFRWMKVRRDLTEPAARFTGDIISYLIQRDMPNSAGCAVIDEIILQLHHAKLETDRLAETPEKEPLIIVAHSGGAIILYDILTHYFEAKMGYQLPVDYMVTVGSQMGLMQELRVFKISNPASSARLPRPEGVKHWINIFNLKDVLSFDADDTFTDVIDFQYVAGNKLTAHITYFAIDASNSFFSDLGNRLAYLKPSWDS